MKSGATYLFLTLFFFYTKTVFTQNNDSVLSAIRLQKDDTSKVNALNAHARELIITADYTAAIPVAIQALDLAQQLNYKKGKATTCTMLGVSYFGLGNYPEALKYHYMSLRLREELDDKKAVAATYHNIGNVYYSQGNVTEAMKSYQTSMRIKRKLNDTLDSHYAHTLNNIANYYQGLKDPKKALELYRVSWQISERLNDKLGVLSTRNNMGNICMNSGNYKEAENIYYECLQVAEEMGDKEASAAIYISIGNLYLVQKEWKRAKDFVTKGLRSALIIGSKDDIKNAYSYLWQAEAGLGNDKQSYFDFVNYSNYRDSLENEENMRASVQAKMLYEFSKKEAAAKAEQDRKNLEFAARRKQGSLIMWSSAGGLFVVIIFSAFLYNRFRVTRKQKNTIEEQKREVDLQIDLARERMRIAESQKTVIEQKQNEILDSIIYARRIQASLLPSEKSIQKTLQRLNRHTLCMCFMLSCVFYTGSDKLNAQTHADKELSSDSLIASGWRALRTHDVKKAYEYASTAIKKTQPVQDKALLKNAYELLRDVSILQNDYKKAREYFTTSIVYRDSILNEENSRKQMESEMQQEFDKKEEAAKLLQEKINLQQAARARQQNILLVIVIAGLAIVIAFSISLYKRFRLITNQKNIIESQKEEVEARKKIADERRVIAEKQSDIIQEKQKEILDSIRYAQRIQRALIPSDRYIEKNIERLKTG